MKRKHNGFSLIEILIALVIIGIISAIAIPAYQDSVNRANRADAIADLNDAAQRLQRCFTTFGRYDQPASPGGCAIYQQLTGAGLIRAGNTTTLRCSMMETLQMTLLHSNYELVRWLEERRRETNDAKY